MPSFLFWGLNIGDDVHFLSNSMISQANSHPFSLILRSKLIEGRKDSRLYFAQKKLGSKGTPRKNKCLLMKTLRA